MLFVLLLLENTSLLGIGGYFNYYALVTLKILLWSLLGVIIIMFPGSMFSGLVRLRGMVIAFALLFSTFYLVCYILMGMFTAFGKNVYSMTPTGITLNMLGMLSALIGGELCRSFLINHLAGKRPFRAIVGFSILFAIFYISLGNISSLNDSMAVLNFISNSVFPQLTLSIVASCLAYLSGPLPSILYLGIIRSFGFLSPYIPSPEMIPLLLFQVFFPLISMYAMMKLYAKEASKEDRSHRNEGITIGWIATAALSVAIVWFSVGVFPIYPSVILTGSMEPKIMPGDMILVKKMSCEHVDVGDIIMFNNGEGIYITHRIIKKSEDTGELLFTTKGDNNQSADVGVVNASKLKGRVIGIIPDLGKPTLYLRGSKHGA